MAVGVVGVARRVEAVFDVADSGLVGLAHGGSVQLHAGLLDDRLVARGFAADALGERAPG